jgi:hypothetical protein
MMTKLLCPSRAELADYLAGLLSGERHEALGRHLDDCADCQARLPLVEKEEAAEGKAEKPLWALALGRGQAVGAGLFENEPELRQALTRLWNRPVGSTGETWREVRVFTTRPGGFFRCRR